jgi:hypothetical protein
LFQREAPVVSGFGFDQESTNGIKNFLVSTNSSAEKETRVLFKFDGEFYQKAECYDVSANATAENKIKKVPCVQAHPDLHLEHAEVPIYPALARAARVAGTVEVNVTVKNGAVVSMQAKPAHTALVKAATDNIKTWHFHSWVNASFTTRFVYELETEHQLPSDTVIELRLPLFAKIKTTAPLLDSH